MELLNSPALLFLDEPTSGLDSSTSLNICQALKRLSDGVCTVVCTIHQPQAKIFDMFDSIVLMKKGNIIYQGSASKSIRFLEAIGVEIPAGKICFVSHLPLPRFSPYFSFYSMLFPPT